MKVRLHVLAATMVLAGLFSAPMSANALGFGSARLLSEIGQPLNAEVDLKLSDREAIEDIVVRHATVPDYERQGIAYSSTVNGLHVRVENRAGKPVAVVSTVGPVREPVLNFILNSESVQGKMSRAFTLPIKTSALAGPTAEVGSRTSQAVTTVEAVREASALGTVPANFNEKTGLWKDEDTKLYDYVVEVGKRPVAKDLVRVKGFDKNIKLVEVLAKVVPKGWKGFAGDVSLKSAPSIDWVGANRYWITILDEVLGKAGMTATVDWNKKEVTFRSADVAVAVAAPATAPAAEPAAAAAPAVAATPAAAVSDADAARTAEQRVEQVRAERLAAARARAAAQEAQFKAEEERAAAVKAKAAADADAAKRQAEADAAVVAKAAADKAAAEKASAERAAAAKAEADKTAAQKLAAEKAAADAAAQAKADAAKAEAQAAAARDAAAERVAASKRESDARAAAERQASADKARQADEAVAAKRTADADRAAAQAAATKAQADEKTKNQQFLASLKSVEVFGEVPAEAFETRTAGFNVALFSAVERILPPGYSLFTQDETLSSVADVSWRGGNRNWLLVLNETVASKGLRAIVNPARKEVFLKR